MRKGIAFFILIILLAGTIMYGYLYVPEIQYRIALITEEDFSEDNIYSDIESLSLRLEEEILSGSDSFVVYLKDMSTEEIVDINWSLDGIYGNALSFQQTGMIGNDYCKVTIHIGKTINFYVLDAYLNGTPIPEEEEKAKELYQVVCSILDTTITKDMSDYQKELALHDYLITHCQYSSDTDVPAESDIYRAYGALVNKDAVCNGYAEAMGLLLRCVDIPSKFVRGSAYNGKEWNTHGWNLVCLDGKWYHLDATWDDPLPDQGDKVIHTYFNVPDEVIRENHKWDDSQYPKAYSTDYNYYEEKNQYFSDVEAYQSKAYSKLFNGNETRFEGVIENYTENEDDMRFLFDGEERYKKVSWQTISLGTYSVLIIDVE